MRRLTVIASSAVTCFSAALLLSQDQPKHSPSNPAPAEQTIITGLRGLRKVPDDQRGQVTRDLALKIRALPDGASKVDLAAGLAGLSTEGDFGHDTLEQVAGTLAQSLAATPLPDKDGRPAPPYQELADLAGYEHVTVDLDAPEYQRAVELQAKTHRAPATADFTLNALDGRSFHLRDLKGKVVVVNFWATWCPPCRKEIPDLEALYLEYQSKGLLVLGIDDEDAGKVTPFVASNHITYPVLMDPGRKVNTLYAIEGIPKTFVYDREGRLVAQSIDMRTRGQFLAMLQLAGIS